MDSACVSRFAAAIRMRGEGKIIACDIHEKKLRLIDSGAARLGIGCVETQHRDAAVDEPTWHGAFDLVIADLPCSGFGVMRKKPEIRSRRPEEAEGPGEAGVAREAAEGPEDGSPPGSRRQDP